MLARDVGATEFPGHVLEEFPIRQATQDDVTVICWHRARMFQDMGLVPEELFESFRTEALDRLSKALASGDYFGLARK